MSQLDRFGFDRSRVQDVKGGGTSDCWLDAAMASVAYADQRHLMNMIQVDSDGKNAHVDLYYNDTIEHNTASCLRFLCASPI